MLTASSGARVISSSAPRTYRKNCESMSIRAPINPPTHATRLSINACVRGYCNHYYPLVHQW